MNAACGGFSAPSCSREEGMLLGVVAAAVGRGILHRIWRRIATSVCLAHTIMKLLKVGTHLGGESPPLLREIRRRARVGVVNPL